MIFKWGSYSHEQAENAVKTEHHAVLDNFGRRIGEKIRYTVLGVKRATTQAGLTTALNTLISEYQNDYRDFGLYLDDGTTPTSMVVSNAATFGGTRVVVPPSMINGPWSGRPEYAQQKTYFLVIECELRSAPDAYYAWRQRLTVKGTGAAKWVYSPQILGSPQYQQLQSATSYWYIQQGMSIGNTGYTAAEAPLYPGIEHGDMREMSYDSAQQIRYPGVGRLFRRDWKYFMEAVTPETFTSFVLPSLS
jgi:hypothetical protein